MTPKEKAKELFTKFEDLISEETHHMRDGLADDIDDASIISSTSKLCALACCNEVLGYMGSDRGSAFWEKVREEINKL